MTRSELRKVIDELGNEALKMVKEFPIPVDTGNMRDNAVRKIPNSMGGWDIIIDGNMADYAKYTLMKSRNPSNFQWTKYSQLKFEMLAKTKLRGSTRKRGK